MLPWFEEAARAGEPDEARHRAEQIVLSEEVLLPPEPDADQDETTAERLTDEPWGLDFLHDQDQDQPAS